MTRHQHHKNKESAESKFNNHWLKVYKSWKKVYCPAFQKDVFFTNKGWQHIQQEKWRTRSEKAERLNYLPVAKFILEKSTTIQGKRLQDYHGVLHTHYNFTALKENATFTVVVIEDKGQIDFLSVFRVTPKM